ncbi:MAG: secretin N-terminal domain-containing protein, partial [Pseudomonadota bacterium]
MNMKSDNFKTKRPLRSGMKSLLCSCVLFSFLLMPGLSFSQPSDQGSVRLPESEPMIEPPPSQIEPPSEPQSQPEAKASEGEEMVYLNVTDQDITDVIHQISKATGKNFIIDDKIRGKVTIISERMMTKEEAYQAFLSALEVAGYTIVTGPGGIIKIVSTREAVSKPIPTHVDSTPYTDSFVTRLIKLENISALDMSQAIRGLVSRDGNMFAYPATNTLIITDSGTNIDRLMKIVKELDQEGPQQVVEIIPVKYAEAKSLAQMVLNLFEAGAAGGRKKTGQEDLQDVSK